ncbi:MAG TPA: alpha/beta fold hydrolase [Xanthobacteraceae bacterium]|nr:alpha/beta fold hydrolase [Xanthobacteraceae bacterium]
MRFSLSHGRALGYRTRGVGPVIAFLHPVGLDGHFWDAVTDRLIASYRVIAIDLPGHGESDVPSKALSLDDMARDVAELLKALAPAGAVLCGCSLGGMVAQGVALLAPQHLRGLILSNASHDREESARKLLRQRADKALPGMPAVHDETIERWFSADFRARRPDVVEVTSRTLLAADPVVHAWSWHAIAELSYGQRLTAVQVPTLALTGSDDKSVSRTAFDNLTAVLPVVRTHVFDGVGHLPPLEVPDDYARVVSEFARSLG